MQLFGYRRHNDSVGFRNHILVLPTVVCAAKTAKAIADNTGSAYAHNCHGCGHIGEDYDIAFRTLAGIGKNPNVAAVLVVALGCEKMDGWALASDISASGKTVELLTIQETGGTLPTMEAGIRIVEGWRTEVSAMHREPVSAASLVVGVKCGGSDTLSGLIANPVVGVAADSVIKLGGTVLLGETTEFIGAEECLAARARDAEVAMRIRQIVKEYEEKLMSYGVDMRGTQPSRGNIEGGLTTIEEKSLGAIHKGGSSTIEEVVSYASPPSRRGLVIMDGPAQDVVCNTGMTAAGAQIILFTTGLGTPVGSPIAPVVKITGTPRTAERMACDIDFGITGIIEGEKSITESGADLLRAVVSMLNGEVSCKAEEHGFDEFDIYRTSVNP